ncbi:unnamed protein product [Urochloa humidicola]
MAARKKPCWVAPGDGVDHFTALPLELRAQIVSSLPFWQVVQLSVLSRPWRDIHHHAPVVQLHLDDFIYPNDYVFNMDPSLPGAVDEAAILSLRLALVRRARDGAASKVDALFLHGYTVPAGGNRMPRHAARIIALADARWIRVTVSYAGLDPERISWALDLPAAARHLQVFGEYHLVPAVSGSGAAALHKLFLNKVSVSEWPPRLPSLRSLTLDDVTVEAAFAPATWCPLLEHLGVFSSRIEQARVDIGLPLLKSLEMEDVNVRPHENFLEPFGEVTIDAPELEDLELRSTTGATAVYRSFALRAPRLRHLSYHNQFVAGSVDIDVGRPNGSVRSGSISFESNAEFMCPEMKLCSKQIMRMLECLLPELSPEDIANTTRPHMKLDKYSVEGFEVGEMIPEERLTCDLTAVMSSLKV